MGLLKRGKYWHFDFIYRGKRFQGSTGQSNINKARLALAAIRSNAALEYIGVAPPKLSPLFKDFAARFLAHVRQHANKPRTVEFYEARTARLLDYFADFRLSDIDENLISRYKADRATMRRRSRGAFQKPMAIAERTTADRHAREMPIKHVTADTGRLSACTINRELATLRKALGLAYEWHLIARLPTMRLLPGEKGRDYVLTGEMEIAYLAAINYPLKQAAILMLDCGLRPEECVSLRKADILSDGPQIIAPLAAQMTPQRSSSENLRMLLPSVSATALIVRTGKTPNAARSLPLTARAREAIALLCQLWPDSEWLFPGKMGRTKRNTLASASTAPPFAQVSDENMSTTRMLASATERAIGRHMTRANLDHLHQAARREHGWPKEFVLYSLRHSFGTRLAESGASPFEIKKAMGHHSVKVSEKYIHLSADSIGLAMKRLEAYSIMLRGETQPDTSPVSKE